MTTLKFIDLLIDWANKHITKTKNDNEAVSAHVCISNGKAQSGDVEISPWSPSKPEFWSQVWAECFAHRPLQIITSLKNTEM